MKKIHKIINNLFYMTKLSFKFSPIQYFIAIIDLVLNSVAPFVDLLFPKWILDEMIGEKRWEKVLFYIVLWTAVNGALIIFKSAEWILLTPYNNKCDFKETQMWGRIDAYMPYSRLEDGAVTDEKNRIKNNLYISSFASNPWTSLIVAVIQFIGYTYIIATLHPLMIVFLLLIIFANSLLFKRRERIKYDYQFGVMKSQRRLNYLFGVMVKYPYAKEVRINKAAEWITEKYNHESNEYMYSFKKNQVKLLGCDSVSDVVLFAQTVALYVYSSYRVITGAITIGDFSMYIGAITAFCGAFNTLVGQINGLSFLSEYIESYKNYMKNSYLYLAEKGMTGIDYNNGKFEIEFQNVSFKYAGSENYVLKNVSVKIRSGEKLSIVGYNGAGKTTFIKLLCRLYEPTEGRILLNGVDISKIKYAQYIDILSVVFQDYNVYPMSIKENVCLNIDVDDSEIILALQKSDLWDKVIQLPHGIDTLVSKEFSDEGVELSGGEGQKLACARAYLKKSDLIIMDEPSASLDPISESKLYERFNNIIGSKTAIYISHRLASTKFCDRIAVFEDGRIIEYGTHDELMKRNGVYCNMFTKQAEYYIDSAVGIEK